VATPDASLSAMEAPSPFDYISTERRIIMEEERKEECVYIKPFENETSKEYIKRIIETRGQWNIPEGVYYENHHIIPKSMGGEPEVYYHTTQHENLIWLLPEEHYLVHSLLCLENSENFKLWNA